MVGKGNSTKGLMACLVLMAALQAVLMVPRGAFAYTVRAPIYINGDTNFTAANGVTGGSGTPSDPYIIQGWDINASTANAIDVRNTISYFSIRNDYLHGGGANHQGVYLDHVQNGRVDGSNLVGNYLGVWVNYGSHNTINASNLTGNYKAVSIWYSDFVNITSNRVYGNTYGVVVSSSERGTISGNAFTNNGLFLYGFLSFYYTTHTIPTDNTVNGKPIYFYKNCRGVTVDGVTAGEVIAANCDHLRLANLTLSNGDVGIELYSVDQAEITHNHLNSNNYAGLYQVWGIGGHITYNDISFNRYYGLYMLWSNGTAIRGNNATGNSPYGLEMSGCTSPIVQGNVVTGSSNFGIYVFFGNSALVSGNNASANTVGIYLGSTTSSTVTNNRASNQNTGIRLAGGSSNQIADNNASFDTYGVFIANATSVTLHNNSLYRNSGYGLYESGTTGGLVYWNDFLGNGIQAYDNSGPQNRWNLTYPGGGNYWSNYTGVDRCRGPTQTDCTAPDGFGDTPFVINGNTRDYYPLMARAIIPNARPVASFTATPSSGDISTNFTFDASASTDAEDPAPVLQVRWNWSYSGTDLWDTAWSTSKIAIHRYPTVGTYTVRLEVRDTTGQTNNATSPLTVSSVTAPVTITVNITADRTSGVAPLAIAFTGSASGGQAPYSYSWDLGDGTTSSVSSPTHTFTVVGNHTVRLTVSDSQGHSGQATRLISVQAPPNPPPGAGLVAWIWPWGVIVLAVVAGLIALAAGRRRRRRRRPAELPGESEPPVGPGGARPPW